MSSSFRPWNFGTAIRSEFQFRRKVKRVVLFIVVLCLLPTTLQSAYANAADAKTPCAASLYVRGFIFRNNKLAGMWIVKVDPQTGKWEKLMENGGEIHAVRISPDGQTIAYHRKGAIWTAVANTAASPGKISNTGGIPIWSPDGKWLIATHNKQDPANPKRWLTETWKFDEVGDKRAPVVIPTPFAVEDWSSDGKWLLQGGRKGLELISPAGKVKKKLTSAKGWNPRFSPDGKRIAFDRSWDGKLYVTELSKKKTRTVFNAPDLVCAMQPIWSPNGKTIAAILQDQQLNANGKKVLAADPEQSNPRITIIDLTTGKRRTLKLPVREGVRFEPTDIHDWR